MLKRFFVGWMIGAVCTFLIAFSVVLVVTMFAVVGEWGSFSLGLGPIELMEHTSLDSGFSFGIGTGIYALPVLGGLLNGLGVLYFTSRLSPLRRDAN